MEIDPEKLDVPMHDVFGGCCLTSDRAQRFARAAVKVLAEGVIPCSAILECSDEGRG